MFTVRGIGDDKPPFGTFRRFNRTGVALMKDDAAVVKESAESCPTAVFFRFFDDDCGNITCANENFGGTILRINLLADELRDRLDVRKDVMKNM